MRSVLRQIGILVLSMGCALVPAYAQTSTPVYPAEQQKPLDVAHDPVVSPDAADNAPIAATVEPPAAQSAAPVAKQNGQFTLHENVEEVLLSATVLDEQGQLVNDLTKDDFKVYENNVLQTISSFQHADVPVSMGLLVDNSGSMRAKRGAVNAAALDLVRASNPQDEAFVVNFSDEAFIDQDFTADLGKLRDGLAHYDARGGTALYDATVASADELSKHAKHAKQVLLIITDGEDNASGLTLDQAIRRVQDLHGPIIYCIGLLFGDDGGAHESREAKHALELLSEETGGIAYFPHSLDDVDAIAGRVAADIRSQYTIGYHSTKPESQGGYRQVKVLAHANGSKKNLNVRTRNGYFAQSSGSEQSEPQMSHPNN